MEGGSAWPPALDGMGSGHLPLLAEHQPGQLTEHRPALPSLVVGGVSPGGGAGVSCWLNVGGLVCCPSPPATKLPGWEGLAPPGAGPILACTLARGPEGQACSQEGQGGSGVAAEQKVRGESEAGACAWAPLSSPASRSRTAGLPSGLTSRSQDSTDVGSLTLSSVPGSASDAIAGVATLGRACGGGALRAYHCSLPALHQLAATGSRAEVTLPVGWPQGQPRPAW